MSINYDAFKKAFPDEIEDMPHDYDDIRDFCNEIIQKYEAAKSSEPVAVSLEKCADAIKRLPHMHTLDDEIKAVLGIAGATYVD